MTGRKAHSRKHPCNPGQFVEATVTLRAKDLEDLRVLASACPDRACKNVLYAGDAPEQIESWTSAIEPDQRDWTVREIELLGSAATASAAAVD